MSERDRSPAMQRIWDEIKSSVQAARRILVTAHEMVDGDGSGSEMALYRGLVTLGKQVRIVNNERFSKRSEFLDPDGVAEVVSPSSIRHDVTESDLLIVVDNNSWARLGNLEAAFRSSGRPIVCLDHHVVSTPFCDLHYVDLEATSTGEIVHDLLVDLGVTIDRAIAEAIYTTLCTDSGWFRHSNTRVRTFELAASCLRHGVDPERVSAAVNYRDSVSQKRLLARFLDGMRLECDGVFAWSTVTRRMLEESGADVAESEAFVDHLRSIDGVRIAAFFRQPSDGIVKLSLRSRDPYSALTVARWHGGGGHRLAAGATLRTTLPLAVEAIRRDVARHHEDVLRGN